MSKKTKISRKKKKHITRKKNPEKHQSHEDDLSQISDSFLVKKTTVSKPSLKEEKEEEIQLGDRFKTNQDKQKANSQYFIFLFPHIFEITCLLLVIFALYAHTLNHSFHFDDAANIWSNPYIQVSSLSLNELRKAGFESVNHNRPVANISFALNYYFHGLEEKGYHLVNIFIHLLAGIMLFYFVKTTLNLSIFKDKYRKSRFIAFFAALIWLVHPLHTQSVTYIVQRMNSMAALFFIMAMLFYVKARLTPERFKKILFFGISFTASVLAFGSKQNTATLPLFILLYEWYFFKDLHLKISKQQIILIAALGCLFGFILYFFLGSSPLSRIFPDYGGRPFTMAQRLLTQPRVVLHYISLLFYPAPGRLNLDYDFPLSYSLLSPPTTLIAIFVIAVMFGLAIYTARKNRLYSFCILWFLGNLLIESSIIPLEMVYEHRTYLPSMMAIFFLVILFFRLVENRKIFVVCLVSVALLFSFWTYTRNNVWSDELTIWEDVQKKVPNKARANLNLGLAYVEKNRADDAIPVLEKALYLYEQQINQGKYVSKTSTSLCLRLLGNAFRSKGEYNKAIEYLNRALNESSNSASDVKTYHLLGQCYAQMLRAQEAVFYFSRALQLSKNFYDVPWMNKTVNEIKLFLEKSRFLLEEQKKRNTIK